MATISQHILKAFAANHKVHGEQADYLIDGEVVVSGLDVIPGKSQAEATDGNGLVTTIDLQDFQCRASELVLAGDPPQSFTPHRGHVLRVTRGEQVVEFVVNHPNLNEAPYRRGDAYGAVLRIHTLQANPAEAALAE